MQGKSRPIRWILAALGIAALASAGLLGYVVADHHVGRVAAIGWLAGLLLVPLGLGVAFERIATRLGKKVRAEVFWVLATPLLALACTALFVTALRQKTGEAFAASEGDGLIARTNRWLGERLTPGSTVQSKEEAAPSASLSSVPKKRKPKETTASTSVTLSFSVTSDPIPGPPPPRGTGVDRPLGDRFKTGDAAYRDPGGSCADLGDASAIEAAHQEGGTRATSVALTKLRYSTGLPFLEAQTDTQLKTWFVGAPDSFEGVASRLDAAIHEGSHVWGFKHVNGRTWSYRVDEATTIEVRMLKNFDRAEILGQHVDRASDSYAETYLEGKSGAQGFNTLLDEYNAYAHTLAARYCLRDTVPSNMQVSARDGILTMMYYVETYLALARTKHAKDYDAILADEGHRRVILTVWDRAEYWLRLSAKEASLGLEDEKIEGWVYAPERLEEIARVRAYK